MMVDLSTYEDNKEATPSQEACLPGTPLSAAQISLKLRQNVAKKSPYPSLATLRT